MKLQDPGYGDTDKTEEKTISNEDEDDDFERDENADADEDERDENADEEGDESGNKPNKVNMVVNINIKSLDAKKK